MKVNKNTKGKTASAKLSANRKASGKKSVTVKATGKEIRINYVAEISKIKNKLVALCIRLYKADKENHRLVSIILWDVPGRGNGVRGK